MMMRDRVERLVVFPFAIGCNSESSVALGKKTTTDENNQPKTPSDPEEKKPPPRRRESNEETSSSLSRSVKKKSGFFSFLNLPKRNISCGIQRLIRSIKSFSQMFVYKDEEEEEEEEESDGSEKEMEIGFPTDVKHVTHIGLDGSTTTNPNTVKEIIGIGMGMGSPEVLSFPTISLKQFELAMAAQSTTVDHQQPSSAAVDLNHVVKQNLTKP
ncbi:CRIB domain-containing protein RIC4-like [Humulus lupulus]|uniref:CRIB domain-containing protein RIC4-like n=1 Tax=Humulus lupulus TaxID=3486 RepID=UPI002B40D514|nr:CRIB domain-containing protein RIC4-like [Humulus lupulus]